MIYLDNAATSLIKPVSVHEAVRKAMLSAASPGRGGYGASMKAARVVYDCREAAARLFHMDDPSRVVFTYNATHALNIAIRSLVKPGGRVLISGFEHNSVVRPLYALGADIRVFGRRLFDSEQLLKELENEIGFAETVICTQVSNVFGYVLPIDRISQICRENQKPLIIDASQGAGILDLNMPQLGADFIAMPGHKALFGPQGTGLLLCGRKGSPLLYGGAGMDSASREMPYDLPERLEAGTMNVPGIAGLLAGIHFIQSIGVDRICQEEQELLELLISELAPLKYLRLYAGQAGLQSGILSFSCDGIDSESFCAKLDQHGIAARGGLHCSPLAHESAGTLQGGTVRLSLSLFTSRDQLYETAACIRDILR